jgi:hypothetical protein
VSVTLVCAASVDFDASPTSRLPEIDSAPIAIPTERIIPRLAAIERAIRKFIIITTGVRNCASKPYSRDLDECTRPKDEAVTAHGLPDKPSLSLPCFAVGALRRNHHETHIRDTHQKKWPRKAFSILRAVLII